MSTKIFDFSIIFFEALFLVFCTRRTAPAPIYRERRTGWACPALLSLRQEEEVAVGSEVAEAVEHQHPVDAVLPDIVLEAGPVVAQVDEVDLREALRQEGRQAVGVGIPDQEQLPLRPGFFGPHHAEGLVAAEEVGVLVLSRKVGRVVELPVSGLPLG